MSSSEPKLISGNANKSLAASIARRMSMHRGMQVSLVDARVERFNDGEIFVEVFENVRGEDMFIIQPTSKPANDNLMELLIMADALRRSSAARITAVIPYFGYARQDRRTKARTPISAKLVSNMITHGGVERVLTMDLHAAQIQGFFDIPVDNLYASPIFALDILHQFQGDMSDVMVVSPDVGGVARARELATRIGAPLAIVDKRREKAGEVAGMTVIGDVKDHKCIIVDDICDTAGTLCKAADVLMEAGATEVHAYTTHGVLSGPAVERITGLCPEIARRDRHDRGDGPGEGLPQHPHRAHRADAGAGHREHLVGNVGLIALRHGVARADLRGALPSRHVGPLSAPHPQGQRKDRRDQKRGEKERRARQVDAHLARDEHPNIGVKTSGREHGGQRRQGRDHALHHALAILINGVGRHRRQRRRHEVGQRREGQTAPAPSRPHLRTRSPRTRPTQHDPPDRQPRFPQPATTRGITTPVPRQSAHHRPTVTDRSPGSTSRKPRATRTPRAST
jgi:ribose-phosphate pyrophosphokinase